MTNTRTLPQIAKAIKALEKNNVSMEKKTIGNVVEIGKLLREADDQCKHGEYMAWLKSEFSSWSHGTALNYRNVYDLTQNRNVTNLAELDISLNALYLVAKIINHDPAADVIVIGKAVIKAAQQGRVTYKMAQDIINNELNPHLKEANEAHQRLIELAKSSEPKMEQAYTDLIKNHKLYEGACHLPWPQYFEYRDAHPDECTPLTPDDLAYGWQWWGSAGPARIDTDDTPSSDSDDADDTPSDSDDTDDDAVPEEQPSKLAALVREMQDISEKDPAWPDIITDIGEKAFMRIIRTLTIVYHAHCGSVRKAEVNAAADRAEKKSAA